MDYINISYIYTYIYINQFKYFSAKYNAIEVGGFPFVCHCMMFLEEMGSCISVEGGYLLFWEVTKQTSGERGISEKRSRRGTSWV